MTNLRGTVSVVALLSLLSARSAVAEPVGQVAEQVAHPTAAAAEGAQPERRRINPYNRDVNLTVPLNFNNRVLGEMPVLLTQDDRFLVEGEGFKALLLPLLLPFAQEELSQSLEGHDYFAPEEINETGISLEYDPNLLAVMVLRIDPTKRTVESLFTASGREERGEAPERFTAYLNTNIVLQRNHSNNDTQAPGVFLNGAMRLGSIVFEAEVQGRESFFTDEYEIERRHARLVYDQPEAYRRWTLGDLDVQLRGRQSYLSLGGIGVERQTRRFDPFRNNGLTADRNLVLQEASTVRVIRNGIMVREFKLDPGQYDVGNLPLDAGSNDVNIEIIGDSGRSDFVRYSAYLDMIDLDPGDYEYGAYLGYTNTNFGSQPEYSDGELTFTGYWRKAFADRPALGVGLQLNDQMQLLTGQTQFILPRGARLQFDAGISNSDLGTGYVGAATFDHIVDRGETYDNWSVALEYTSEAFAPLGSTMPNQNEWMLSANYNHRFNQDFQIGLGGSYRISRDPLIDDAYSVSATASYRITPQWNVVLGADYRDYGSPLFGGDQQGYAFNLALVWQPSSDRRAESRYSSANNSGSVTFQQYSQNRPGSLGYAVTGNYNDGAGSVTGQLNYIGNRFDAGLSHTALGRDFSNITEQQVTSLRVGSAIAYAGGKVAMGRSIYDSFAIIYPHESLADHDVIVGQGMQGNDYNAKSGVFGPALTGYLSSYVNQSVKYDVLDPPRGYNIGEGISRLYPYYKSGYAIEVGSANFVSAMGRLVGNKELPVGLMSGRVRPADAPDAEHELFFTNSSGRFAIQNLAPGRRYRVELYSSPPMGFEFDVPADNGGLLDLQILRIPLDVPED